MTEPATLALRLAGPLQSWGTTSQFNRRGTADRPSKAGIVGLLAAAQGRRRGESITDLLGLTLGVRVDQPGLLLTDYHTVSSLDSGPLLTATVNKKGLQVRAKKLTHITRRDYLQDAVFLACIGGDAGFLQNLAEAVQHPHFPLALGRRNCPPAQPLVVPGPDTALWPMAVTQAIHNVPWQAGVAVRESRRLGASITVMATIDDDEGDDALADVPISFDPRSRGYLTRRVRHVPVTLPTGREDTKSRSGHDPFALLGW